MTADQLGIITDTFNQLSYLHSRPVICILWAMIQDQFDGKRTHLNADLLAIDWTERAASFPSTYEVKKVCRHLTLFLSFHANFTQNLFAVGSSMRYYLSLSNNLGDNLSSVVFITHVPHYEGSSDGHWIATEHNLQTNSITLWDSLLGDDRVVQFAEADSQLRRQWVAANLLYMGQSPKVRFDFFKLCCIYSVSM